MVFPLAACGSISTAGAALPDQLKAVLAEALLR
jgi:hypothetical protein